MPETTEGEITPSQQRPWLNPPWKPGQSGNPLGRPKGARGKLSEDFLAAMHEDFQEHGPSVIAKVRAKRPHEYLKIIASILPKQAEITVNEYESMDEQQLRAAISATLRDLSQFGIVIEGTAKDVTADQGGGDGQSTPQISAVSEAG